MSFFNPVKYIKTIYFKTPVDVLFDYVECDIGDALFELGQRYYLGKHVKKDIAKGLYLISQSIRFHCQNGKLFFLSVIDKTNYLDVLSSNDVQGKINIALFFIFAKRTKKEEEKGLDLLISFSQENLIAGLELGMFYFGKKQYEKALPLLEKCAQEGNSKAQCIVGCMHLLGYATEVDKVKATSYFLKSANQGYPLGSYSLALAYTHGYQGRREPVLAIPYLSDASKKGHIESMILLGKLFLKGDDGVSPDYEKARDLFECVKKSGSSKVDEYLGQMYFNGYSYHVNYDLAFDLLTNCATINDAQSFYCLGLLYKAKIEKVKAKEFLEKSVKLGSTDGKVALAEIYLEEGAYQNALKLLNEAKLQNCPRSYSIIGDMYHEGLGLSTDFKKAVSFYIRSIELGDSHGQFVYGKMLFFGEEKLLDQRQGALYLAHEADSGNMKLQMILGKYYYDHADHSLAFHFFNQAAKNGNAEAMYFCSLCLDNFGESERFLRQAAEKEHVDAMNEWGRRCYVYEDYDSAIHWLKAAAEKGSSKASYNLALCYLIEDKKKGRTIDYTEARCCLVDAIAAGEPGAQKLLDEIDLYDYPEKKYRGPFGNNDGH